MPVKLDVQNNSEKRSLIFMFIDRAVVTFIAGKGGNGCLSFRREKFIPKGGPNGGDGGGGGTITLVSNNKINSLIDFKNKRYIRAEKGENGSGSNKTGKNGENITIFVPAGTFVKTFPDEKLILDFSADSMSFVIVKGGKGGRGNSHFKSSVNQTPRYTEKGSDGEVLKVVLELKLIAFAGLVGYPNAGKSTLISRVSAAKPKIAAYPFTTLHPNLGVVYNNYQSLVIADIPGIIAGAHKGEGMGTEFLRHIERNKVLIFLIDISQYSNIAPLEALKTLREEIKLHKSRLVKKKYFVVGSKIDLPLWEKDGISDLKLFCKRNKITYMEISAIKDVNLEQFKAKLFEFYHD